MYQNIFVERGKYNKHTVHLWDDEKGYYQFPFKNYAYVKDDINGTIKTIYGDLVKKTTTWTKWDMDAGKIFESDVPLETKVLVDLYFNSDEISTGHREVFFDIEVEMDSGLPDSRNPKNMITAISLYDRPTDEYYVYILDPEKKIKRHKENNEEIIPFEAETDLLVSFLDKWDEIRPTIITGWNIDFFDTPYLYRRMESVLGRVQANRISPIGKVYYSENRSRFFIAGVSSLDYLALYRKFTYTDLPSYSLDAVARHEVKEGKVKYDGSLERLREENLKKFIDYNLTDTKLVVKIDEKMRLLEQVKGICHKGHVPLEDVYYSSRWIEGAMLSFMKSQNLVAPNKRPNAREEMDGEEKYSGAYVKSPEGGLYEWLYDLDFTSLYPSVIMSLNISPETKLGKIADWDSERHYRDKSIKYKIVLLDKEGEVSGDEIDAIAKQNNLGISSNGVIYRQDEKGIIPTILEIWYEDKDRYDKLMKEYGHKGDHEKSEYYSARRNIAKVMLNSVYGVLGLPVFRFFDIDNAEAVTTTGVTLIKYTEKMGNFYYTKETKEEKDYCLYIDTDSVFFPAKPLVEVKYPEVNTEAPDQMTDAILKVCGDVQKVLNSSFDLFAQNFLYLQKHKFDLKQEIIAKSGMWIAKKRYALWIINDSGVPKDKIKYKGLDVVRSNFPEAFRKFMKEVIENILKKTATKDEIDEKIIEFREHSLKAPVLDIAIPTGVKGIKKYSLKKRMQLSSFGNWKKATPAQVKASISYNELIDHFNLQNKYPKIASGEKIKWVYLRENPYQMEGIAFKGYEDPPEIIDFIEKYIDRNKIWEHQLNKKLEDFYSALGWHLPSKQHKKASKFFDF